MRRILVLSIAVGLLSVNLGCKHVAGKSDCSYNPASAQLNTGSSIPYATIGAPINSTTVPEKMPAPLEKLEDKKPMPMPNAK